MDQQIERPVSNCRRLLRRRRRVVQEWFKKWRDKNIRLRDPRLRGMNVFWFNSWPEVSWRATADDVSGRIFGLFPVMKVTSGDAERVVVVAGLVLAQAEAEERHDDARE